MHEVPLAIDEEVARLKLEALGLRIDELTPEQTDYLASWGGGSRASATSSE